LGGGLVEGGEPKKNAWFSINAAKRDKEVKSTANRIEKLKGRESKGTREKLSGGKRKGGSSE